MKFPKQSLAHIGAYKCTLVFLAYGLAIGVLALFQSSPCKVFETLWCGEKGTEESKARTGRVLFKKGQMLLL